ncbi:MAG: hypothetical protein IT558_00635 [Alphaproteobacteria bacterium]|nr:hypothetical protein [Alphaproteobacteria bacterium]
MSAFERELNKLVKAGIAKYGVGFVTADLQNKAAELLRQCDDHEFKRGAVVRFEEQVMS